MILLGLFTHFVLTELKPLDSDGISGVTVYEWIIYVWVFSLGCQEVKQVCDEISSKRDVIAVVINHSCNLIKL